MFCQLSIQRQVSQLKASLNWLEWTGLLFSIQPFLMQALAKKHSYAGRSRGPDVVQRRASEIGAQMCSMQGVFNHRQDGKAARVFWPFTTDSYSV